MEDKFIQGFACAIACLIRTHDEVSIGMGMLRDNGFNLQSLRKAKVDGYDYDVIKQAVDSGEEL